MAILAPVSVGGNNWSGGTTFTSAVVGQGYINDTLVMTISMTGGSTVTNVTDNAGQTWTQVVQTASSASNVAVWTTTLLKGSWGPGASVTITTNTATTGSFLVTRLPSLLTATASSSFDLQTSNFSATAVTSLPVPASGTTGSLATYQELVFGAFAFANTSPTASATGYTKLTQYQRQAVFYKNSGTSLSGVSATFTLSAGFNCAGALVTFKPMDWAKMFAAFND